MYRRTCPHTTPLRFAIAIAIANGKTFRVRQPVDSVNTGRPSVQSKQDDRPSAVARPTADDLAICWHSLAGPSLRKSYYVLQIYNGVTLGGRPYHFCEKLAKCDHITHLFRQHPQLLRFRHFHGAIFGFPVKKHCV